MSVITMMVYDVDSRRAPLIKMLSHTSLAAYHSQEYTAMLVEVRMEALNLNFTQRPL